MSKSIIQLIFISFFAIGCKSPEEEKTIQVSSSDVAILSEVYQRSLFALKLSEEALTRSNYIETKNIASEIIAFNRKIKDNVDVVAGKRRIDLPLDINEVQLRKWKQLISYKGGWEFDEAYLKIIVDTDNQILKALNEVAQQAADTEIKKTAFDLYKSNNQRKDLYQQVKQVFKLRENKDSIQPPVVVERIVE